MYFYISFLFVFKLANIYLLTYFLILARRKHETPSYARLKLHCLYLCVCVQLADKIISPINEI